MSKLPTVAHAGWVLGQALEKHFEANPGDEDLIMQLVDAGVKVEHAEHAAGHFGSQVFTLQA